MRAAYLHGVVAVGENVQEISRGHEVEPRESQSLRLQVLGQGLFAHGQPGRGGRKEAWRPRAGLLQATLARDWQQETRVRGSQPAALTPCALTPWAPWAGGSLASSPQSLLPLEGMAWPGSTSSQGKGA